MKAGNANIAAVRTVLWVAQELPFVNAGFAYSMGGKWPVCLWTMFQRFPPFIQLMRKGS